MLNVVIVDYDMGNLQSVANAIDHIGGASVKVSSSYDDVCQADALILPGVGAYRDAMKSLKERDLIDVLNDQVVKSQKPMLGICLGMQLLFDSSAEGGRIDGLGWIPGTIEYIDVDRELRVPHVGWNDLIIQQDSVLLDGIEEDKNFYFVHSYSARTAAEYVTSVVDYGGPVTASVRKGNVFGVQFHPEKSQANGMRLLANFLNMVSESDKGAL